MTSKTADGRRNSVDVAANTTSTVEQHDDAEWPVDLVGPPPEDPGAWLRDHFKQLEGFERTVPSLALSIAAGEGGGAAASAGTSPKRAATKKRKKTKKTKKA